MTQTPVTKCFSLLIVLFLSACNFTPLDVYTPETDHFFRAVNPENKQHDVVFVLGGGGVKGIAHLGVLEELELAGIRPDLIVGCSAGAIVGALYAHYPSAKRLDRILLDTTSEDFMEDNYWPHSRFAVKDGGRFKSYLTRHFQGATFDDLSIPLVVVATDLGDGKLMELHEGDLASAVQASGSVPGVFEPVQIFGKYFVDGGAVDNIPVQTAKKFNPKIIIAVDISEGLSKEGPTNLLGILKRAIEISYRHQVKDSVTEADVAITMNFHDIGLFDESKKQELYETGRQKAREAIPGIKRLMKKRLGRVL